jgi:hypothetical protein
MTNLTNKALQSVYGDLVTVNNDGQGLVQQLSSVQDGFGNSSPMSLSSDAVNFNRQGGNSFQLDGEALTASADSINEVCQNNNFNYPGNVLPLQLPVLNADPLNPVDGMIFLNSVRNEVLIRINGAWAILEPV